MTNQAEEKTVEKVERVKLSPEQVKANRAAAARRTLEKRKAKGIAAKQFFIHKSLFKEAEEVMAPIIAKSKEIVAQNA